MADDKKSKPKKRRVKDPETFRERAMKASEAADKTKTKRAVRPGRTGAKTAKRGPKPLAKVAASKPARVAGKVLLPAYFRNSWRELKLVTWPNWRESRRLTFAVLIFAVAFGASIALVDYGLDKVFRNILLK